MRRSVRTEPNNLKRSTVLELSRLWSAHLHHSYQSPVKLRPKAVFIVVGGLVVAMFIAYKSVGLLPCKRYSRQFSFCHGRAPYMWIPSGYSI